jgi:hypothetical protein
MSSNLAKLIAVDPRIGAMIDLAIDVGAPAVEIRLHGARGLVAVTCEIAFVADRVNAEGWRMPPSGGCVVFVVDDQGPLLVARAQSMPLSLGGAA